MSAELLALAALLLAPQAAAGAEAQDDTCAEDPRLRVVATSGGARLTLHEVDARIASELEALRDSLESARLQQLQGVIVELLLDREAARRGTTRELLLRSEVQDRVRLPTVQDARERFEQRKDAYPGGFGAHRAQILQALTQSRHAARMAELMESLRPHHRLELLEGLDLADSRLSPSTALASVDGTPVTLGRLDSALGPLPALIEEEQYELRRAEIDAWLESAGASPGDGSRVHLLSPRLASERLLAGEQPARGPEDAPTNIVAFVDFQCPNCAEVHGLLLELLSRMSGAARLIVRDFPLADHQHSAGAAAAAEAAMRQGRYWDYAERLFSDPRPLERSVLLAHARALGLDLERFEADSRAPEVLAEVERDRTDGAALGVYSTPTVFVNGRRVVDRTPEAFQRAIEQASRERAPPAAPAPGR